MKNKISLFDTEFAKLNGLDHGSNTTVKYLIDNRRIILTDTEKKAVYDTKGLASTAASAIVNSLVSEGLLDMFSLIDTSLSGQSLPELLAIPDFTADMKQMPGSSNVMNSIKEYKNKIVFNLAPIIKRTREGYVTLTNLNDFHLMVTRGALVNSYYTATGSYWLNPNLLKFIARSYSSILAVPIVRHFRLSVPEQLLIETILAYFIMSRMADNYTELLSQCEFLGSKITIKNTIDSIEEKIGKDTVMTLSSMCDLMVACGPEHMHKFNVDIFKRMCGPMGSSSISTNIALEYPPYWVYQLIYTLSDNKTYLGVLLQQTKLLKPAEQFLQQLISSRQFIPALKTQGIGLESLETTSSSLFEGYDGGKESFLDSNKLNDSLLAKGTEGIGLLLLGALAVTLGVSYISDKIDSNKRTELIKKLQPFMAEFDSKIQKAYINYKRAYTSAAKTAKSFTTVDKHLVRTSIDTARYPLEDPKDFVKSIVNTVSLIIHKNLKQAVVGDNIYVTIDSPLQIIYDYEKVWESPDEIYTDPDTNKDIDAYRLEATIIKKIRDIGKSISSTDVIYDVSEIGDHTRTSFKINTYITTGDIDKLVAQIKSPNKEPVSKNAQSDNIEDPEYGTMIKTRQGLVPNKLVPLTNINGKTNECKIIFVDYDSKGITDKHRKTLAFLLKNKSFIKNKFNMKTFESYIDDFDIDTPASEVAKDTMFSKLYIYPNGAFYVDVTLPHDNQYSGLDIIFYVDKSLKSMGVDYGEGGGSYLDIGEENLRNNPFALRRPIIDDKTDGADTTRTSDGVLIMDPTVGRLQYAHGVLRTLGEVEIPTFRGIVTRKHINYEIVDENEPTLTVEQVYATQRMVKFGGVFQHTEISDKGIYTLEDINVSAEGISTFSVSVLVDNNTTRYFECINNPRSDKLDSILEVSDSMNLPIKPEEYVAIEKYYSDDLSGILGVGYEADGDSIGSYVKKIFNWIVEKITMLYNKVVEFLMKVKNFFSPSKIKEDIEEVKSSLSPDNEKDVKAILDEVNDHINNAKIKSVDPELVLGLVTCLNEFNQSLTYEDTKTHSSEHKDNVVQTWYNKSNQKYKNEFVEITKTERVKSFEKETTLSELLKRIIPSFDGFNIENLYTVYEDVYTSLADATEKLKKEQTDIIHSMRNLANTSSQQMMGRSAGVVKTINSIASQLLATAQLRIRNEVFLYNDTLKKIHMSLKKILDTVSDNKVVTVTMEDVTEMDHAISTLPVVMEMDGYKVYKFADYKKVFDKFHFVLFGPGKLDNISDTQVNAFAVSSNNASNDHIVITDAAARSPEWVRNGIVAHEIGHIVKGHNIVNLEKIAGTPDKRVDSNSLVAKAILKDMYRSPKQEIEADTYCYQKYGKETTIKMLKFIAPGYAGKILDYLSRMIARFFKRRSDTVKMAIPFLPREDDVFTRIKYFENKTD